MSSYVWPLNGVNGVGPFPKGPSCPPAKDEVIKPQTNKVKVN